MDPVCPKQDPRDFKFCPLDVYVNREVDNADFLDRVEVATGNQQSASAKRRSLEGREKVFPISCEAFSILLGYFFHTVRTFKGYLQQQNGFPTTDAPRS